MTAHGTEHHGFQNGHCRRAVTVAVLIVLLGQLIGASIMSAIIISREIAMVALDGMPWRRMTDTGSLVLFIIGFAYIPAAVPCVLTAAVLGWRTFTHGTFGYGMAAAVAALATFAGLAVFELMVSDANGSFVGFATSLLPFALLSALIGRWLMAKFEILPQRSIPVEDERRH
jgi:hypothetical protein